MLARCRKTELFAQYWEESEMEQPFWKTFWLVLNKTKYATTMQLNQLVLGIYPREMRTQVHKTILMFKKPVHKCLLELYL